MKVGFHTVLNASDFMSKIPYTNGMKPLVSKLYRHPKPYSAAFKIEKMIKSTKKVKYEFLKYFFEHSL